jgi:DNA-binding NtrC family response regulator
LAVDARLAASVTLIESCALGAWPGNVRELLREIRRAGHRALEEAVTVVQPHHLAAEAGAPLGPSASAPPPAEASRGPRTGQTSAPPAARSAAAWSDEQIAQALADNGGNVRGTARALGMHRNQLRRWLEKHPELATEPSEDSSSGDDS